MPSKVWPGIHVRTTNSLTVTKRTFSQWLSTCCLSTQSLTDKIL